MGVTIAEYGVSRLRKVLNESKKGDPKLLENVIKSEVTKVLKDYTILESEIKVNIDEENEKFVISINAKAERIKPFGILPTISRF